MWSRKTDPSFGRLLCCQAFLAMSSFHFQAGAHRGEEGCWAPGLWLFPPGLSFLGAGRDPPPPRRGLWVSEKVHVQCSVMVPPRGPQPCSAPSPRMLAFHPLQEILGWKTSHCPESQSRALVFLQWCRFFVFFFSGAPPPGIHLFSVSLSAGFADTLNVHPTPMRSLTCGCRRTSAVLAERVVCL